MNTKELRAERDNLLSRLIVLNQILKLASKLDGGKYSTGKGNRKPRTAAQKAKIAAALKKHWADKKSK